MRLKSEQLPAHLNRPELLPVYYVSGDEPLQLQEAGDLIRARARELGHDERIVLEMDTGFDWGRLQEAGANLSLFSSKRIIELRLGDQKPGREGGAALAAYAAGYSPDNLLLLTSGRIDRKAQQAKWFKALEQCGCCIQVWPVEPAELPGWIMARCRRQDKRITRETAGLIAQRVEGNLLAAQQEIDKLALLVDQAEIDGEAALNMVVDSARYDVFDLIENVFLGKPERVSKMLRGLRNEGIEALNVYGALMWGFRRAGAIAHEIARGKPKEQVYGAYRVLERHRKGLNMLLRRFTPDRLSALLVEALEVDKALKGVVEADGWRLLEKFMFTLAGYRLDET
ncbi:MAG: DNA polymerase III subunit delta [Gammaproteobacteria bacterium]|nr:DNA polymerase III subunit delta [Gammaproteobacteria bacterium]